MIIQILEQAAYFYAQSPRFTLVTNQTGQAVVQLFESMRYKPEGGGFETSGRTMNLSPT
jgi:hypothetical protein